VEEALGDGVALAGDVFEGGAIEDADLAAVVVDEIAAFEDCCGDGDGGSPAADHLGQELLGEVEAILADAIGHHEKPARKTRLDVMEAVAGGDLAHGEGCVLYLPQDKPTNGIEREELLLEGFEVHAKGGAGQLDEALCDSRAGPMRCRTSGTPSRATRPTSMESPLSMVVTTEAKPGRDEVNVLWGGVRTIDAGSKGKRDGFEAGEKRLPQLGGEPIEE